MKRFLVLAVLLTGFAALAQTEAMCVGEDSSGNVRRCLVDSSGRSVTSGALTSNSAAPGATNTGCLGAVANAAAPTYTEGMQVLQSVDLSGNTRVTGSGTFTVAGAKTNNAAAPGATNVGTLACIANAAAPSYTEGYLVACSMDLAGNQRVNVAQMNGVATSMGNGVSGTGVQRVAIASDNTTFAVGKLSHNAAAPAATSNVGALGAIATAAAPSYTEGYLTAQSVDLSGAQRSSLSTAIAGENLAGVVGDVSSWLEVRLNGRTVSAPTATTTEVAATACATPSAAGCTVIYASTDVLIWKDITITIRNSDASDALTQVIVEWSPTGSAGTWESWDSTTFAALATSTTKSLAISGNSRRFLRIEAGAAAVVTSAVVNITAAQ